MIDHQIIVSPRKPALLDGMFRLRARVFGERLGWHVNVENGLERDRYDDEQPVYIVATDAAGVTVLGSLRVLPTTGPTLLAEAFADTCADVALLSAPSIWECTRFCVDGDDPAVAAELIAALGELALRNGIETILGNFDERMLRIYRRIGCKVEILGESGGIFLGAFHVSSTHLQRIRQRLAARGDRDPGKERFA